jgi:hypothetical protein
MAKFKGSVYESTRAFVQHEFGADGVERVLARLCAEDRQVLHAATAIAWIPVEPVLHFHQAIESEFGKGDLSVCVRAGQFSAGWSMNSILKMFVRLRSPHWLVDKAASVWSRYHDTGHWELFGPEPHRVGGKLIAFEVLDPHFCARLRGWLQGAVELTGGKGALTTELRCRSRGHEHCAYSVSFQS